MREIKFRTWDNDTKQMIYPYKIDFNLGFAFSIDDQEEYQRVSVENLMQFTGQTDKNGKGIFEGDIVKTANSIGDIQFDYGVFGIEWVNAKTNKTMVGSFGQKHNLRRMDDGLNEKVEVIGNIYENPELLEPENE